VRHILVKTEDQAKDVLKRLKKGEKFGDIAAAVSICPSKERGGDLGWQTKGMLSKEVEDAAFSVQKGQVTGPVKTKWGYHVILIEDQKPASKMPFDEAKEYIVEQLAMQKQQEFFEKLAENLRQKTQVQITQPQSAPVPVPTVPTGPAAAPKK
jgi:peptidyl-prolyl cis-trans isomerase C